jgi:hypothetical protein
MAALFNQPYFLKMKRLVFYFFAVVLLHACNTASTDTTAQTKTADSTKVAEEIRSNMSFLNDYNALEAVFGNENWMLVNGKDTSYYYFSRLGDFNFNTYAYKLVKGDSSNVYHGKIRPEQNKLAWDFDGKKLLVISATVARVTASADGTDSAAKYEFTRLNNSSIGIVYPDQKKTVMRKTIPFGLFLVRSRYDHTNGTHFAFDTTQYTKKH